VRFRCGDLEWFLRFVRKHGFTVFAVYRLVVAILLMLLGLRLRHGIMLIMRSTRVKTAWTKRSNTRSLRIITPFKLSAPANFRMARHPPGAENTDLTGAPGVSLCASALTRQLTFLAAKFPDHDQPHRIEKEPPIPVSASFHPCFRECHPE